MQPFAVPLPPAAPRIRQRTALVASADRSFRQRLAQTLTGLRWHVREAEGGAQAWAEADAAPFEAVIVDSWLPDLDLNEFLKDFRGSFPNVDIVTADGTALTMGRAVPTGRSFSTPCASARTRTPRHGTRLRAGRDSASGAGRIDFVLAGESGCFDERARKDFTGSCRAIARGADLEPG